MNESAVVKTDEWPDMEKIKRVESVVKGLIGIELNRGGWDRETQIGCIGGALYEAITLGIDFYGIQEMKRRIRREFDWLAECEEEMSGKKAI